MELTIEQALKKGVPAHKEGKLVDSYIGYTHLTYLNPDAVPAWGGETELQETPGISKQVAPEYISSVVFKSSILPRGLSLKIRILRKEYHLHLN